MTNNQADLHCISNNDALQDLFYSEMNTELKMLNSVHENILLIIPSPVLYSVFPIIIL